MILSIGLEGVLIVRIVYLFPNKNKSKTANRIQSTKFANAMWAILQDNFLFISGVGYEHNKWHIQFRYLFSKGRTLQFLFLVFKKKLIQKDDILYIRDYKLMQYIYFLKKIKCIANNIVCEVHDIPENKNILKSMLHSNKLIAISDGLKNALINFGYKSSNILVSHSGFDTNKEKFCIDSATINTLDKNKTIVYIGGYQSWKNIEFIIEMANSLKDINFLFIGLEQINLKHCLITDNIFFIKYIEHKYIYSILCRFKYAILSLNMHYEISNYTSPLKLFEYLSAGLTVFVPNIKNMSEIIQHSYNGYLYDFNLESAVKLIRNVVFRHDIIDKNLIKDSVKDFSWENRANKISKWLLENV